MSSKCLVLGGNGFIGSHVVDALVLEGHEVTVFDRIGKYLNFDSKNVKTIDGDFMNRNDLALALKDIEYVFHFISTTTPITAENDPLIDIETNIRMSVVLFQECVKAGVKRILFASTGGAIYGLDRNHPIKETELPLPVSPYAIGKYTIEQYLRYFSIKHGLDSIAYRISNPYGTRQPLRRKQGVIPIFMENIYNDKPITILGAGDMVRDYIYVKDVAKMISKTFSESHKSNVYNIGTSRGVSVNELVELVELVSGKSANIVKLPKPDTFVQKIVLDTSMFNKEFGLAADTTIEEGMSTTWKYILEAHKKEENDKA